jgi:hypothetical protein
MTEVSDFFEHMMKLGFPPKDIESTIIHAVCDCMRVMGPVDEDNLHAAYLAAKNVTAEQKHGESNENFADRKAYLERTSLESCTVFAHIAIALELKRKAAMAA